MNENIKNLVDAMLSKDANGTQSAFQAAMAEKISAKLDDMRQTMAQNMFKQPEAVVEEETITEEQYEALSEEEKAQYEVIEEDAVDKAGKIIKKVAQTTGKVVGGVAKTAGVIRQTPAAIATAYNQGRAGAQKAIA